MRKILLTLLIFSLCTFTAKADRIYVMNSGGYNTMEAQLQTAIAANGHTITVNNVGAVPALPVGFTSTCSDPVAGYDYLCFFGTANFTPLLPDIQAFINDGGKVFYQYEVTCCTQSSTSASAIAAGLTGLAITPDPTPFIALGTSQGWEAVNLNCCATFFGNAYKGMNGIPLTNQLQATANLNGSNPAIATNTSFGFVFHTTDFIGTANSGGMIGLGDVNIWYDGDEPFSNGGNTPVNTSLVDFIFPSATSTCFLFPPGCLTTPPATNTAAIAVDLGPDTLLCNGDSLLLDATAGGATYLWQDGSTAATFSASMPGTYWVTVSNTCGVGTDSIVISNGITPPLNLGNDTTICSGDALQLDISSPGATYLWSDGTTNPIFTLNTADTIWATASLGNCSVTDSLIVDTINVVTVDLGNDTVLCAGDTLNLSLQEPNVSFLWQDGTTDSTITITQSGFYWVDITNACGTTRDSIEVTLTPLPTVNLGTDTALCQGESLLLDVGSTVGSYAWQNASVNQTFMVTQAGTYWVDYTVNLCTTRDSIIVNYNPFPIVNLGLDTTLCAGQTLLLDAGNPTGTFNWQNSTTNQTQLVSQAGIYWVDVTINNCVTRDSVMIDYTPLPTANLGQDDTLCANLPFSLDASNAGATYLWQDNSTNAIFNGNQPGTYSVAVTVGNCTAFDTITLTYYPPLDLIISGDITACSGDTVSFFGNSDLPPSNMSNWLWNFDDGGVAPGQNAFHTYNSGGNYNLTLTATSTDNCTETITSTVSITQSPKADFSFTPTKPFLGEEVQFEDLSDDAMTWEWDFGNGLNSIEQEPTTVYEIEKVTEITQIVTNNGCSDEMTQIITFSEELLFYVPNIFIPTSSSNPIFQPVFTSGFDPYNFELTIFNRWGEIVFQSFDASVGWDGNYGNNGLVQNGTYVWKINFRNINIDEPFTEFGTVTVLR